MRRLRTVLIPLALLAAPADALAADGRIVFESSRAGDYEIYTMDGDGSDVRRLTRTKGWEFGPAWSPDGKRIAFESRRDGTAEIYVMGADGSAQTRLTHARDAYSFSHTPTWSPTGATVMYASNNGVGGALWTVGADGAGAAQLTGFGADTSAASPAWSPDGTRVAFTYRRTLADFTSDLYVMNADGTGLTQLTATADRTEAGPAWSPDGSRLAFVQSFANGESTLEVMRPDGSDRRTVTSGFRDYSPAWSPDGRRLAFDREEGPMLDRTVNIHVVDVDGGGLRKLTHGKSDHHSSEPEWIAGGDELGPLRARAGRKGVAVSFRIAAPAQVTLTLRRCKASRKPGCTPVKRIARATFAAAAGPQSQVLAAGRALAPGRYRLEASTHSDGRAVVFRVK